MPPEKSSHETLPPVVAIGDSVLYQELEDEVVLLNMESQEYFGLNEVGAQMWKCLMAVGDVQVAGDRLSGDYAAESSVIHADLHVLVRDLLAAGLLKAV
ncbi:MAG: PqqD family protein [Acidobacteriota bacterium]|nr:PqqD family protein [Acidobacteriota bacterium]